MHYTLVVSIDMLQRLTNRRIIVITAWGSRPKVTLTILNIMLTSKSVCSDDNLVSDHNHDNTAIGVRANFF